MVSCRVVVRSEEKWMRRMDEKSNKKASKFPISVISRKFNLWLNLQEAVFYCFFKITVLPQQNGGTHVLEFFIMW